MLAAAEHVRHSAWHGWQTVLLSGYLLSGVHEATQVSMFMKGWAPAQEVQSPSNEQVWQLRPGATLEQRVQMEGLVVVPRLHA